MRMTGGSSKNFKIRKTEINISFYIASAFDPKPFIRTFEGVLEILHQLKSDAQKECNDLENSTREAETEYRQNIEDLHGAFDVKNYTFF